MNAHTQLIPRSSIEHLCKQRAAALDKITETAQALEAAYAIGSEAHQLAGRAFVGSPPSSHRSDGDSPYAALFPDRAFDVIASVEAYRKNMDRRIWDHLLEQMGIRKMMDAEGLKELRDSMTSDDVPEATLDNVRATLQQLYGDTDLIFRRGLVNCFAKLDRRFKSHDGFKIGSRIIVDRAFNEYGGDCNYGSTWDTIADVERVLAVLDGANPEGSHSLRQAVNADRKGHYGPQQSKTETAYFRIDGFKNGNAHLWFTRDDLVRQANKILAEHYGEVLPDGQAKGDDFEDLFNKSSMPSKDLQFYPTQPEVVRVLLKDLHLSEGAKVLEPSAGQGAIALAAAEMGANVYAIEIDPKHIDVMKGAASRMPVKGSLRVKQTNFLAINATPSFDFVMMNPPFYGTHYMDHVKHAFEFLAPGGMLRAILPASAEVNESRKHNAFRKWAWENNDLGWAGPFRDLPAESFKASGTMINTVILHLRKPR